MIQINNNIFFKIKSFKNIKNDYKHEIKSFSSNAEAILKPIETNFNGWGQAEEAALPYVENEILKFPSIENVNYSVNYKTIENIKRIEFDWKVDCSENDSSLCFFKDNDKETITGFVDWEHKSFITNASNIAFAFMKNDENSTGTGTGYFKNIKIYTMGGLVPYYFYSFFDNETRNKYEINTFVNKKIDNNYKIDTFVNRDINNTFKIKGFLNKTKQHYYKLGKDLSVPPKRIIFKNFED